MINKSQKKLIYLDDDIDGVRKRTEGPGEALSQHNHSNRNSGSPTSPFHLNKKL